MDPTAHAAPDARARAAAAPPAAPYAAQRTLELPMRLLGRTVKRTAEALAAMGFGVWTLLWGLAVRAFVRLWLAFRYSGYRPSLGFDWGIIRGDLGFSAQLTLNWFGRSHSRIWPPALPSSW